MRSRDMLILHKLCFGNAMKAASNDFAADPCSSVKRGSMIKAARSLLTAVTRLLSVADMADIYKLIASLKLVTQRLKDLDGAENTDELLKAFKNYGNDLMKLAKLSGLRQADLKDSLKRDEMAAARATLKKSSRMLFTTAKAYLSHPEVASAKKNRDFVMKEISEAIRTISGVAQFVGESDPSPFEQVGPLAKALSEVLVMLKKKKPSEYQKKRTRLDLEKQLNDLLAGAISLAESSSTRDNTREKLLAECDNVKQALKDLLDEYMKHAKGKQNEAENSKADFEIKAKDLGKQIRKAITDHVSNSFLETKVPLLMLVEAAEAGNENEVKECALTFTRYASKLGEVARLSCAMVDDTEGVKMVRSAANQLQTLCPQVLNAALTLDARPRSKEAKENMNVFRDAWLHQVEVLTEAVDDITTIDDFLAVSESYILEDVNKCIEALQNGDGETLGRTAGAVRSRVARVDNVVSAEMGSYEQGPYTETVNRALYMMRESIMPQFADNVDIATESLNDAAGANFDELAFVDASKLIYEGIRDVRRAVMMKKGPGEEDYYEEEDGQDADMTLLASLADAQRRQRENAAYQQLKAGGKLQFEIHSEGGDDAESQGGSSIIVNGVEYCPKQKGHNIVVLDAIGDTVEVRSFDTEQASEGVAMAKFLDNIPEEHIALIAAQDTSGKGIEEAAAALNKLGALQPIDPGVKGSWAFAGFKGAKGKKNWVTQVAKARFQGPAVIADTIDTPARDQGKIKIEICSESQSDADYSKTASIKINGFERSTMQRGMNVVLLDRAGNYLMSKNFDTADPIRGRAEGQKMADFLDNLPSERMVCVAALEAIGDGMNEIKEALVHVGADDDFECGTNGSFALLGYTGETTEDPVGASPKVQWVKQVSNQPGQGPSKFVTFFVTPEGAERIRKKDDVDEDVFQGYEPEKFSNYDECKDEKKPTSEQQNQTLDKKCARSIMKSLPAEEKAKIAKLNQGLNIEKNRLVTEVNKWDDESNEIISLSKKMCMLMMDMSDFTRGAGAMKTTMDVIKAAERIAKMGKALSKVAAEIAERCPHSTTKCDLLAYLQRIALYSHQLTITSRVKADVQMVSGELVVSGLDSATSLIQAAKNLMTSVILTVKTSYVASTKYRSGDKKGVVNWRMRAPAKKPIIPQIKVEATDAKAVQGTNAHDQFDNSVRLSMFQKQEL